MTRPVAGSADVEVLVVERQEMGGTLQRLPDVGPGFSLQCLRWAAVVLMEFYVRRRAEMKGWR